MNKLATIALAALVLAGCAAAPVAADMPLRPTAQARMGETVTVGPYRVTPVSVLEDSRCPAGVTCVWAGQVRLSVRVVAIRGGERFTGEMTSLRPLQLRRGELRLRTIQPANTRAGHPRPAQYRFGFQFTSTPDRNTTLS